MAQADWTAVKSNNRYVVTAPDGQTVHVTASNLARVRARNAEEAIETAKRIFAARKALKEAS